MPRLAFLRKLLIGLALVLPLACNLTTVDPTSTPLPTLFATVERATSTPTATNTVTPTATKAPTQSPTAKPVFHLKQPLPAPTCSVVPAVDAVNIRSGAGTNFPVIGIMDAGNWVLASRLMDSGWYQITASGTVVNGGWISNTVVTLQQPCICTPNGCTQSGIVPPTIAPSPLPLIGVVGLKPSGAAACVITAGDSALPVYSAPQGLPPVIATLTPHGGLPAFDYREGRYAVNFSTETQQLVGWIDATLITTEGNCAPLIPPTVCSVQPSVGRIINVYAEPKRDAKIVSVMNPRENMPFIQFSADGWFSVNLGIVGSGWVAPDEGMLVGPCDNGH